MSLALPIGVLPEERGEQLEAVLTGPTRRSVEKKISNALKAPPSRRQNSQMECELQPGRPCFKRGLVDAARNDRDDMGMRRHPKNVAKGRRVKGVC